MRITKTYGWVGLLAGLCCSAGNVVAKTLSFAGEQWEVKSGVAGPGPNNWSEDNAWVDELGQLHLKISYLNGAWYAAEVYQLTNKGFGNYEWHVSGQLDQLNENVVLGLFHYQGPDGQNEIDIEMARWGDAAASLGNFTVYPAVSTLPLSTQRFAVAPTGTDTVQRYSWNSTTVCFQMFNDNGSDEPPLSDKIASWQFAPKNYRKAIPQVTMPLHINLWLRQGLAPTDGQEVEVIIKNFSFTPSQNIPTDTASWCQ